MAIMEKLIMEKLDKIHKRMLALISQNTQQSLEIKKLKEENQKLKSNPKPSTIKSNH